MPNGLPNPWDFGQGIEREFNRVDNAPAIPPPPPVREYALPSHLPTMEELWSANMLAPPPEVHYFPAEPPPAPEEFIHKPIETRQEPPIQSDVHLEHPVVDSPVNTETHVLGTAKPAGGGSLDGEPIAMTSSIEPEVEPETEPVEPEDEPEDVEDEVARAPWEEPIPAHVPEERSDEVMEVRPDAPSEVGALVGVDAIIVGCPNCNGTETETILDAETGFVLGMACSACGPLYTCTECGVWEFEPHLEGCVHG